MRILFGLPLLAAAVLIIWAAAAFGARKPEGNPQGEYRFIRWVTANTRNTVACVLLVVVMASLALRLMTLRPGSGGEMSGANYAMALFLVFVMAYTMAFRLRRTRGKYVVIAVFALAAVAWTMWPNWLTINVLAVLLALSFLVNAVNASISFRFAVTLNGGMFLYDILHVYITGWMQGAIASDIRAQMPMLLIVPKTLTLESGGMYVLGLGDVLVPGFMIVAAAALAYRRGVMSLLYSGLVGYAIGLILAGLLWAVFRQLQPALITLFPCTLAGILLAAWRTGVVGALFEQRHLPWPGRHSK